VEYAHAAIISRIKAKSDVGEAVCGARRNRRTGKWYSERSVLT